MTELTKVWGAIMDKLSKSVSAISFDLWLKNLEPIDIKNEELILATSSVVSKDQILKNYKDNLNDAIKSTYDKVKGFNLLTSMERDEYLKNNQPKIKNNYCDYEFLNNNFNPRYTFDNFVVAQCNNYAYAACRAVAENPSTKFNPLFIYGGVGLGKTHMMQAIGNFLLDKNENKKVAYVTCENFTNDYIDALRTSSSNDRVITNFRNKYRNVDVLMIDDIQFISNKIGLQEEFFHTFNDLFQKGKQIILSSDRHPREISALEERLKSRFSSGLTQDIQKPDFETRVAILQKKALLENMIIDDDVLKLIAERIDTNIRELEGVLHKVIFYANLLNKEKVGIEDAKEALKNYMETTKEAVSGEKIISAVSNYYSIPKEDIIGKRKNHEISLARQVAIYLICEMLTIPLTAIGELFSNRDHTTIMHSRDKITDLVSKKSSISVAVLDIRSMLE